MKLVILAPLCRRHRIFFGSAGFASDAIARICAIFPDAVTTVSIISTTVCAVCGENIVAVLGAWAASTTGLCYQTLPEPRGRYQPPLAKAPCSCTSDRR